MQGQKFYFFLFYDFSQIFQIYLYVAEQMLSCPGWGGGGGEDGYSHYISYVGICTAVKDMVFKQFSLG